MPSEDIETILTIRRQCRALRDMLDTAAVADSGLREIVCKILELEQLRPVPHAVSYEEGRGKKPSHGHSPAKGQKGCCCEAH
jgi:hypothetical protein